MHTTPPRSRFRHALPISAALAIAVPSALTAQELGWDVKAEANASLFFGNTRQSTFATRFSAGRADSTSEVETDGQFTYGEAESENGRGFVTKRSWRAALTADYRPFARFSPFMLASVESSFEKRIDRRYSAGAGAKLVFVRSERTLLDFSLALLAERSLLPDVAGPRIEETQARYSARFRWKRSIGERVAVTHETFYRPEVRDIDQFTFTSRTSIAMKVAEMLAFQASFLDNHDSGAKARGARTNNDGEFLFGLALTL